MQRMTSILLLAALLVFFRAGSAHAEELAEASPLCPTGTAEAETLFQRALDLETGRKGDSIDYARAAELYQRSVDLGSSKAAINLGLMYRRRHSLLPDRRVFLDFSVRMYVKAWDMGCPDALAWLAHAQEKGWGMRASPYKAVDMLRFGAEANSPLCMMQYGKYLQEQGRRKNDPALRAQGIQWLIRSLELGNGDAGGALGGLYADKISGETPDAEKMLHFYREGAKRGSRTCLYRLSDVYSGEKQHKDGDRYKGQIVDRAYAACFARIEEGFEDYSPPHQVDLDALCPPRRALPFADKD